MAHKTLRVLFAASELTPLAKVGGLGDVIGSLPQALVQKGVSVKIIIPKYEGIRLGANSELLIRGFPVVLGRDIQYINIYKLPFRAGVDVILVENEKYLSKGPVYFSRTAMVSGLTREIRRFLFFSKAVGELVRQNFAISGWGGLRGIDLLHAHDWHTGALVRLLKKHIPSLKIVFTIHNLENQGIGNARGISSWFGDDCFTPLENVPRRFATKSRAQGLIPSANSLTGFTRVGKNFNFMREGIEYADAVTTVSSTYAREILTKKYGVGLEGALRVRAREKNLTGILNGIDYDFWPAVARNKIGFQKRLGLRRDAGAPIFALVSRLVRQKGIGLVMPIIEKFSSRGAQFIFLGQGERVYERMLVSIAKRNPGKVFTKIGFDEKLAHSIYGQSDFFLMPSIFEPSGLGQMISMHYGTVPIVRKTGGLCDTVANGKTGFVFKKENSASLASSIKEALACYARPHDFEKISKNCMMQDFSWNASAREYVRLYKTVLGR